jgi:hypothetical protein
LRRESGLFRLQAVGLAWWLGILLSLPPPVCRGRSVTRYDPRFDRDPTPRALAEVKTAYRVLCPTGDCGSGRLFRNDTIGNNAVTWVSGLGAGSETRAKIVYSAPFLNGLEDRFGPGASFGVLAHEVGHHLTAALALRQPFESSWDEELRADYLAGCALGRAGRPPTELEHALKALAATASPTHPAFDRRVPVVRKGYEDCRGQAGESAEMEQPFGLGGLLSDRPGCWTYRYRLEFDVKRAGPIAAPRRRAGGFDSKAACEAHRQRTESERRSEACACSP